MNDDESDLNMMAVAVLMNFDHDDLEEKAAVLEHDAGLPHDRANRTALYQAMKRRDRRMSWRLTNDLFEWADQAVELERRCGWQRAQTIGWLMSRLAEGVNARV